MLGQGVRPAQTCCFLLLLAAAVAWLSIGSRVEVDDAFIVLRTAENFARGHGLVFSPGDTFMPVTCPLWTMLLGGARALLPTIDLVEFARITSIVLLTIACTLMFAWLRPALGWFSVLLAPLFVFAKEIPEHVGNELGLAITFAVGGMFAWQRGRTKTAAALIGLYYLTRGEGVLLAALVFGSALWRAQRDGRLRARCRELLPAMLVCAGVALSWHVYHAISFGSLLPKTLDVKVLQGHSGQWRRYGRDLGRVLLLQGKVWWLVLPLCVLGLRRALQAAPLLPAWAALHVAFYSALRVPNYDWYYYPLFVVVPATAIFGLAALHAHAAARMRPAAHRLVGLAAASALLAIWVPRTVPSANPDRLASYRKVAQWLDARAANVAKPPLVLAFEIGIIGYYAPTIRMIDPPGILVPGLTKELLMDWHELVRRHRPDVLVFREALGERILVGDTHLGIELPYELTHTIAAEGYPQHLYTALTPR
jgi:hypothetical protein